MKAHVRFCAGLFPVCTAAKRLAVPRSRNVNMYPYLPAESLTSVIQIGMGVISLLVAMFSFLVMRSA